jgi:hypothetical protein
MAASVAGLGPEDINDGAIINATNITNVAEGVLEYSMTLPSGVLLKSAPFQQEMRGKAMLQWMEAVRGAIISDVQSSQQDIQHEQDEARARAARGNMSILEGPGLNLTPGLDDASPPAKEVAAYPTPRGTATDPVQFAQEQAMGLRMQIDKWDDTIKHATESKKAAEAALEGWNKVIESFTPKRRKRRARAQQHATEPYTSTADAAGRD